MTKFRSLLMSAALGLSLPLAMPSSAQAQEPSGSASSPRQSLPVNILLVMADDLAPRLGAYGAPVKTPNLDALAKGGVIFDRAYSQFPWCGPSRASMLTGARPNTTRVFDLATSFRKALPDIQTLPQYFKERGWYSGRIGKIYHQGVPGDIGRSGPDDPQSWTEVVNPRGHDRDVQDEGKLISLTPGIPYGSAQSFYEDEVGDEGQTDGKVATAAIEMIRANKQKPFFIAVGFYRPHVPEVVPKAYFDLYPLRKIKVANETPDSLARVPDYTKAWMPDNFGMSPDEQRKMIQAYSAATTFMDAQVGRVLKALEDEGLAKNTVVVFASDHGFMLGEHGQWMKNVLWDGSARTPLIIRAPGFAKSGSRSSKPVELVDLYPTLTEIAGLQHNDRNEGTSLVPLLRNPNSKSWHEPAFSQVRGGRSVMTERYRYTEWEEGQLGIELYDHKKDAGEKHNLAHDPKMSLIVSQLKALLPSGAVEARGKAPTYNPIKDCLSFPPAVAAAFRNPAPGGGGDGTAGLAICEAIDP